MKLTISVAIDHFLISLQNRCEQSTITHYKKRFASFKQLLGQIPIEELTADQIKTHIGNVSKWPDGTPKAPDTIRTTIVAWMQLQKWLVEEGHLAEELTPKYRKPSGRKRELLLTTDDVKAVIAHSNEDFVKIFRALRLTGARPGELCQAQISDIDRTAGEIVLKKHKTVAKTGKPRRIALGHPALIQIIEDSIGDRTAGHIFLRRSGRPWRPEILSELFHNACKKAGLREGLVLYLCRHGHATELYKQTGDLKTVADALGHTQLSTTMRYTRVDSDQLKKNQCLFNEGLD